MKVLDAGGVAAVGDQHHDVPALAALQFTGCQINSVIKRRAAFGFELLQALIECGEAPRVIADESNLPIEAVQRSSIVRVALEYKCSEEFAHRVELIAQLNAGGAAGIHQHSD